MATFSDPPTPIQVQARAAPQVWNITLGPTATTTYCYRTALGVRGTTTDPGAIPAGAEVERVVTA